jgi:glycosyltransferase involved in cell wall biosynthesis
MPRLTIVVPAYNEAARIPTALVKLAGCCRQYGAVDLLVVDDGSRDQAAALVEEFAGTHRLCPSRAESRQLR